MKACANLVKWQMTIEIVDCKLACCLFLMLQVSCVIFTLTWSPCSFYMNDYPIRNHINQWCLFRICFIWMNDQSIPTTTLVSSFQSVFGSHVMCVVSYSSQLVSGPSVVKTCETQLHVAMEDFFFILVQIFISFSIIAGRLVANCCFNLD